MILATIMAFLAPASYAASTITDSHLSNKVFHLPSTLVFYGAWANLIMLPILFLFGTPEIPPLGVVPLLACVALIETAYLIPYMMSLKKLDTSIVNALFSLGRITAPLFAFLIVDEKLSLIQYVGFLMIISASIFLSLSEKKKGGFKINSAFWLMFSVAIILSLSVTLEKSSLDSISWISLVFWQSMLSFVLIMGFMLHKKTRKDAIFSFGRFKKNFHWFFATDAFNMIGLMCSRFALAVLPVTASSAIASIQPFYCLLFGVMLVILFKRKHTESVKRGAIIKKSIGLAVTCTGIFLTLF